MSAKNKDTVSYEVITQEDPETGDLILPIPPELMEKMGWKEGDELEWKNTEDGKWILIKKGTV